MMNEEEFFGQDTEVQSNWFKFEKIGDKVKGTVSRIFEKEATLNPNGSVLYPKQLCFSLEDATVYKNGVATKEAEINVGVKYETFYSRLRKVLEGDMLGFVFDSEIPAKTKGFSNAKVIVPHWKPAPVIPGGLSSDALSAPTKDEF
jgi:hypothetical protein